MVDPLELALTAISALLAYSLTPALIRVLNRLGHVRPDAHKPGKPSVAYSGGIALYAATTLTLLLVLSAHPELGPEIGVVYAASTIAFTVGLVDDVKVLGGEVKTGLTLLAIMPIVLGYLAWPAHVPVGRPLVPILGRLRLTVIYWLLLPLAAAGPANVVNMLDVFNGVMPATTLLASIALAASIHLVYANASRALLLAPLMGALIGYLPFNRNPARILNGDSGSLFVGAYLGVIAILTRMEFVAMIALMPHILNGALVIGSIGGLKEHRKIRERPTYLTHDFRLAASRSVKAPVSLTRLILAIEGPLTESEVVSRLVFLEAVCSTLAVVSALMIPGPG